VRVDFEELISRDDPHCALLNLARVQLSNVANLYPFIQFKFSVYASTFFFAISEQHLCIS